MANWTTSDIPSLHGRTAVITGTGGLGFEDAKALAEAGARVILAGRNPSRGAAAVEQIRQLNPGCDVCFEQLDLASLDSIDAFAKRLGDSDGHIDLLINNAGVMTPPQRQETADGFELQFGTNHLGHFALTAQLLPLLRKGDQPRVVSLSSIAARQGAIDLSDLQSTRGYKPMVAYSQSKLACLMFALELQRRSNAAGWGIRSIAAHPGVSRTELLPNGAGKWSAAGSARRLLWFLFQPAAQGALPTLFAATAPQAQGGAYYGPNRLSETRGYPVLARTPLQAMDLGMARRLWNESERLTGMSFPAAPLRVTKPYQLFP
ncbi:SDR family oxidoreductase [Pseudomonas sp. MDMC216]|jgi:NAD(P)-dependent dehydrogenase (short-subunit alcohol dehydrogenase family)|uniref:NADP-dependent 3-hydroxy acid dehydrogenase YdfG n=1 Tax=Ectopseudomonas chengduensis TaxID=489632 RepID=A0A1G6SMT5_9GAMM|nr:MULTISPECIES: SDR family oxidoreductase [Pseudomonas]MBA4682673.1 SDR family oxidoreductase [Pseudomonas sp.]KQO29439.1 short-chain dehydrogenase [Pseudomonas sp. Leaf83]MBP3064401.1 SDR family NAD(P)-dependent oxidoreductase [Pseudomonas chengduensis]MDH0958323.1 SDR family oxidoreductase [Pseudomonas chengduensis]MDH1538850.1 SDR family oxidoreductase [Pseudomonas chengduensis]